MDQNEIIASFNSLPDEEKLKLISDLEKSLNKINSTQIELKKEQLMMEAQLIQQFEFPLVPPEILQSYMEINPKYFDKLQKEYFENVHQNRELNKMTVETDNKMKLRGLNFSFILGLIGMDGGFILAYSGQDITALGSMFIGLGSMIGSFIGLIYSSRKQKKKEENSESEKKN